MYSIAIFIVWIVGIFVGALLTVLICMDRMPNDKCCTCYYNTDGIRAWPGNRCSVHKNSRRII